jgi:parallel beta-helix repeat protein
MVEEKLLNMKKHMHTAQVTILVILAVLFVSSTGWTATYYVDKDNPNASNSNPGTENLPWRTIQHAVDSIDAGDTTYIKAGIYNEQVLLAGTNGNEGKSGNAVDGYITYAGYPGDEVILDGGHSLGVGFKVGKYTSANRPIDYIKIKDLTIRNYVWMGICWWNDGTVDRKGSHHIIIENITVYGCGDVGINFEGGVSPHTTHDITIRNCKTYNNGNHGIKFNGDDAGVTDRELHHDSTIEDCVSYSNDYTGIHVSTGAYNITVRNNISYSNGWHGISGHEIWDSVYEKNHVYSNGFSPANEDEGIIIWISNNVTVRENYVHDNAGWGIMYYEDLGYTSSSHSIENNVIYSNGSGGIYLLANITNTEIYHNTIASNQGTGLALTGSGHTIKNNILYQNSSQLSPSSGNTFDYNLYYPDFSFGDKDSHYVAADPLFLNVAGYDFHLTSASPAVDAGIDVGNNIDIERNLRPKGKGYDIGAYEYGA